MNSTFTRAVIRLHDRATRRNVLGRMDELNRTQWLGYAELMALQRVRLQQMVEYAYQYVPYYRRAFDHAGFHPKDLREDLASLTKIPVLTKAVIRENWNDLLTTEPERRKRLSKLSTSGSTGQPLVFMQDYDFRDYATASVQHHLGWAGWKLGDFHALMWGAPLALSLSRKIRVTLLDFIWNRFQINSFNLSDENLALFTQRILQKEAWYLFGYATSIYTFAQYIRQNARQDIRFKGIFTTAESLLPPVRLFIEETFGCKIFNRYGSVELGGIACECEAHTGYHINAADNFVEVIQNGHPANPGEVGEIIVTNLNNRGMPFIRYSIGDAGTWSDAAACPCGRVSPMLASIEGRLVDSFYTRDGRRVWSGFAGAPFRCLANPTIKQFQVVQKTLDKMVVRLVPDGIIPTPVLDEITQAIRAEYGENVAVDYEFPDEITPLPSGKHQYAVSELNKV